MTSVPRHSKLIRGNSKALRSKSVLKSESTTELDSQAELPSKAKRRYSVDTVATYYSACDELEKRTVNQKAISDIELQQQLENISHMRSKCSDPEYQKAIDLFSEYLQEIIDATTNDVIEGKCTTTLTKLLQLQLSWKDSWPDKIVITRNMLMISKFSRLVSFLVISSFIFFLLFSFLMKSFILYFYRKKQEKTNLLMNHSVQNICPEIVCSKSFFFFFFNFIFIYLLTFSYSSPTLSYSRFSKKYQ